MTRQNLCLKQLVWQWGVEERQVSSLSAFKYPVKKRQVYSRDDSKKELLGFDRLIT